VLIPSLIAGEHCWRPPREKPGGAKLELDILRVVKRAKILQRKNPSTAAEAHPFPFFDPDYPVKPWIAHTGERFQTVSVPLQGSYLAFILEDPNIRHTAKTRRAAEDAVKRAYSGKRNPATSTTAKLAGLIVILEWEKPYYVTYVPELDNISTYGKTREQALERTKALILAYVETSRDLGYQLPLSKTRINTLVSSLRG
jgi:predicted RNase H-like HicB family nuclease